jgi:hypothetical protein
MRQVRCKFFRRPGHFHFLSWHIWNGFFYSRATRKADWRKESIGCFCIQSLEIVIEGLCAACFYFIAYCFAACILFHA